MNELIKVRDMSLKYDISARALKYYEDMGLLASTRSDDYAYRMYDEEAVKKLEQILILRKLNISVKDIKRIFSTSGSEVVLEVLGKKVNDIDGEVSLLHELKEIIIEFIDHIRQADFSKDADVKLLYEKARDIEGQLINVDYNGNPGTSKANRLIEVTEILRKPPEVRIVDIKPFKAVTTGSAPFHEIFGPSGRFMSLMGANSHRFRKPVVGSSEFFWVDCPNDFKFCPDCGENCQMKGQFIWALEEGVTETDVAPHECMDFKGGLYAVVMTVDEDEDMYGRVEQGINKWLETSGFELDMVSGRKRMTMMMNPSSEIKAALGYDQQDMYVPVKVRDNVASLNIDPYPRKKLSSPSASRIVSMPDEGRDRVMEIAKPNSWAVAYCELRDLGDYQNKNITITFSAEVMRTGAAGRLNWNINNGDYPSVVTIDNAAENVWHQMSGTWTGVLTEDFPKMSLDTYKNNSESTIYYIDNFKIDIVTD